MLLLLLLLFLNSLLSSCSSPSFSFSFLSSSPSSHSPLFPPLLFLLLPVFLSSSHSPLLPPPPLSSSFFGFLWLSLLSSDAPCVIMATVCSEMCPTFVFPEKESPSSHQYFNVKKNFRLGQTYMHASPCGWRSGAWQKRK